MEGRADASFLGCLGIYVQIYRGCQVLKVGCVLGNLFDSKKWRVSFLVRPSSIRPASAQQLSSTPTGFQERYNSGTFGHTKTSGNLRNNSKHEEEE